MAHHDVVFPTFEGWEHEGGPGYETDHIRMDSGQVRPVQRRQNPEHVFSARFDAKSPAQSGTVIAFYKARGGRGNSFNYFDPRDHTTQALPTSVGLGSEVVTPFDQVLGAGDGTTTTFQLVKRYSDAGGSNVRTLRKIIAGTTRVAVAGVEKTIGVDFTVNLTTGEILFMVAPAAAAQVTAGCQFYVPVFFGEEVDRVLAARLSSPDMVSLVTITLVEALYPGVAIEDVFLGGARTMDNTSSGGFLADYDARLYHLWPICAKVLLPDLADAPEGGPIFAFVFPGTSGTCEIRTHDDATLIHTMTGGPSPTKVRVYCGRDFVNAKTWIVFP